MSFLNSIILGALQGFTEFLPISSSGHLVLGQHILNINLPGNELEIVMHMGTLLSILVVFWKDILALLTSLSLRETQRYVLAIVIGTIPAVVIGLGFKDFMEAQFDSTLGVGLNLAVTGVVLLATKYFPLKKNPINLKNSLWIGMAQAFAILPGISRSGMTISMALGLGIKQSEAARFSFLLAIPAIAGAGVLKLIEDSSPSVALDFLPMLAGFLSSFIVGTLALVWLIRLLKRGKFYWFGFYCLIIGILTLITNT